MEKIFKVFLCAFLSLFFFSDLSYALTVREGVQAESIKQEMLKSDIFKQGTEPQVVSQAYDMLRSWDPNLAFTQEEVKVLASMLVPQTIAEYKPIYAYFNALSNAEKLKAIQGAPYKAFQASFAHPIDVLMLVMAQYLKSKNNETFNENESITTMQNYVLGHVAQQK